MAWLSGIALVSINVVTLRQARYLDGMTSHPGQLSLLSLRGRLIEYQPFWLGLGGERSLGGK